MDRGAWRAAVRGVTERGARLSAHTSITPRQLSVMLPVTLTRGRGEDHSRLSRAHRGQGSRRSASSDPVGQGGVGGSAFLISSPAMAALQVQRPRFEEERLR